MTFLYVDLVIQKSKTLEISNNQKKFCIGIGIALRTINIEMVKILYADIEYRINLNTGDTMRKSFWEWQK